jgi:hypothetical protein
MRPGTWHGEASVPCTYHARLDFLSCSSTSWSRGLGLSRAAKDPSERQKSLSLMRTTALTGLDQANSPPTIMIAESARFPKPLFNLATRSEATGKSSGQNRNRRSSLHELSPTGRADDAAVKLGFIGCFAGADVGVGLDTAAAIVAESGIGMAFFARSRCGKKRIRRHPQRQAGSRQAVFLNTALATTAAG